MATIVPMTLTILLALLYYDAEITYSKHKSDVEYFKEKYNLIFVKRPKNN